MKLVASGWPEENLQNVYELDFSVVYQVMANGEALMNLASIKERPKLLQYHHLSAGLMNY